MRYGVTQQHALYQEYKNRADFLTVYIREAHAVNEWPLGVKYCWNQPKTIMERISLAKLFVTEMKYQIPVYCDTMENMFNGIFSAWPERYYIFYEGKLAYKAMPHGENFEFSELKDWLEAHL